MKTDDDRVIAIEWSEVHTYSTRVTVRELREALGDDMPSDPENLEGFTNDDALDEFLVSRAEDDWQGSEDREVTAAFIEAEGMEGDE